ncbi:MAG: DUF4065 domain-containing protein [Bryobacterales bacterium]|nr:DUF4065 domain-containing protein [Bryobacterales bacterium]
MLSSREQRGMPIPYPAKAVANYFLNKNRDLTQMKLHKLVYYAHGWHLGFMGQPLLDETLEAWTYGPVVPSVYSEFWRCGSSPIRRLATAFDWETMAEYSPEVDPSDRIVRDLLARVWEVYGDYTAAELSNLTHAENSPWTATRKANPGVKRAGIPNKLLRSHFEERIGGGPVDG